MKTNIQTHWSIMPETGLEYEIVNSPIFIRGASFGNKRRGHPEGSVGIHIKEILDFIDKQCWEKYRTDLRLLALFHDLGKCKVVYSQNGHVVGKGHSIHSMEIAQEFISNQVLLDIISVHDKYAHFYSDGKMGKFKEFKFLKIYDVLDLEKLIRFNYADSNNREKDSIKWFEDTCVNLGLRKNKVYEDEPGVLK